MSIYHKFIIHLTFTALIALSGAGYADMDIYHIDVEQGDATLFVTSLGATLLVDSGKNGHGKRIKSVMTQANINHLDHVITTHYHEDHYGGIDELHDDPDITIGQSYDRGDKEFLPDSKTSQKRFMEYNNGVGQSAIHLQRGMVIQLDQNTTITCIASGGIVLGETQAVHAGHENDMSLAITVNHNGFTHFIGGDIHETTEGKIADKDIVQNIDVYQANHHGSHTSSSLAFMQDLSPDVIIISNGNHGGHMHPRQHTLNTYFSLDSGPVIFQTNKYLKGNLGGNVSDTFIADIDSTDTDGTIKISVNSNQRTYTVSYRDQQRPFTTKTNNSSSTHNVVIESLTPNPVGSDNQNESVTINNKGSSAVDLSGWTLIDISNRIWALSSLGTIQSGDSKTIVRNGMPMSLNNNGDTIRLIDADNNIRDEFQYSSSTEGQAVSNLP